MQKTAIKHVREAKNFEAIDVELALNSYQLAYNAYCELEKNIDSKTSEIAWAKVRFSIKKFRNFLLWLLAALLSGLVSMFLTCDYLKSFIISLIK